MIRSRNIADYFDITLSTLKPGVELLFDVHLYFPQNQHLMVWRKSGEAPTAEFLDKYVSRGLSRIWIHKSDEGAYQRYLSQPGSGATASPNLPPVYSNAPAEAPAASAAPATPEAPAKPEAQTEAGAFMAQVMDSPHFTPEQKKAILANAAQVLLQKAALAKSREEQKAADELARKTIEDVLDMVGKCAQSMLSDVWKLAKLDPELDHSFNVATYAVIFAMAFGKIDPNLIADLAMAGLLHDVGISQVRRTTVTQPWKKMSAEDMKTYSMHVGYGLEILKQHAGDIPPRVVTLIHEHHEKFDGTGYPQALSGFKVNDLAQLVAIADVLDAVTSGHWDGQERTLKEGFELMETLEKAKTFPEHFNPEVFSAVIRWIRSSASQEMIQSASHVVEEQVLEVIEGKRA